MDLSISFDFTLACEIAALCLVAYDTMLTLSREMDCVWRRKLNFCTVIFVSQKWVLVSGSEFGTSLRSTVLRILGMLGAVAFSTLKIWAIWGHHLTMALAVLLTSTIVPALRLYSYSQLKSFSYESGNCFSDVRYSLSVHSRRIAAIANDLLVLILTWIKVAGVWRESLRIKGFKPTFTVLLLRDGTLSFVMLLVMNVVALALNICQVDSDGRNGILIIANAITACLISRFILDLRQACDGSSSRLPTLPTLSNAESNGTQYLGNSTEAPPVTENSTWVAGPSVGVANDQQHEEAALLFRVGLGIDIEVPREMVEYDASVTVADSATSTRASQQFCRVAARSE
ncbi:hypothetical protein EIP91_000237 [Steccherinum ochraceum]|uniref:DUF6533 domain-containing protein n=1 Tax=Steccherinum ochraceum TaxID=92696 RepID=A0A4R0RG71_9APHY|nr:hypothetical protein EIP91_000237 [Steccherinum ochraceum]